MHTMTDSHHSGYTATTNRGQSLMQRDMELVREILLAVEADKGPHGMRGIQVDGYTTAEIDYNMALLKDVGFIEASDRGTMIGSNRWDLIKLTWTGHDFLENARDSKRWKKAKDIASRVGSLSLDALRGILATLVAESVKQAMRDGQ